MSIDVPDDLGLDATQLIYRTAQEGLRNVVSHAEAAPCRPVGHHAARHGGARG